MKKLVAPQGRHTGIWQFFTIVVWIVFELIGFTISLILGKSLTIIYLSGLLCAIGGYLFLEQIARYGPPKDDTKDLE